MNPKERDAAIKETQELSRKTQAAIVGTETHPGIAEGIRTLNTWVEHHEKRHERVRSNIVKVAVGGAIAFVGTICAGIGAWVTGLWEVIFGKGA